MSLTVTERLRHLPSAPRGLLVMCGLGLLILGGCTSTSSQNSEQNTPAAVTPERVTTGSHRVNQGDTLWSIAFRFGWDWKELAQLNGIQPPYVIYPGQVIRFDSNTPIPMAVAQPTPVVTPAPITQTAKQRPGSKKGSAANNNSLRPSSTPAVAPITPMAVTPPPVTPPAVATAPVGAGAAGWLWPANGQIISRFSSNGSLNKGIDIAGQLGQPVLAAADGSVVYAGSGLRGYGELVIIKHNDTFVSAYGHNQRLLVREGQQVKTGQTIAEMGSTGTDRVKLHFEIRKQGKPVDPMEYLPNR